MVVIVEVVGKGIVDNPKLLDSILAISVIEKQ